MTRSQNLIVRPGANEPMAEDQEAAAEKLSRLLEMKKNGEQIVALTAYDYPSGRLLDEAGVDLILVGDSLGMVVLGYEDTTSVTIDEMTHHLRACRRGVQRAPLVADLPFNSYETPVQAVENARRLIGSGADAVKLEGGTAVREQVEAIVAAGIGIVGHIGMLPQHVREEGGYKKKGKTEEQVELLLQDARDLEIAGAVAIVLEGMVPEVAAKITENSNIPTIGIGAGPDCDGQILVTPDLLGAFPWFRPAFAKARADVAGETQRAVAEFIDAVRNKQG